MLSEITIRDFAIIDEMTLQFDRGFNVLTGETGAGKSIILDAMSLLMGGRADASEIRTGAQQAVVEATFVLAAGLAREIVADIVGSEDLEGDDPSAVILSREVRRNGRNVCRVNGHVATLTVLQQIADTLVDIHGQSEHLSLQKPETHLDLLDRYAGLMDQRRAFSRLVRRVTELRTELDDLVRNERKLKERSELLAYQIEEITAAILQPGEEDDLRSEARRLANAEQLASLAQEAYQTIYAGRGEQFSASDLLGEIASVLARLVKVDPQAAVLAELSESLSIQIEELGRGLAAYQEAIEFEPSRLQEIELRLDMIRILKRKYSCDTIDDLLRSADEAKAQLGKIEHSSERIEELREQESVLLAQIGEAGAALSAKRQAAAVELSRGVESELADLRMENARFGVSITQADDPGGAPVGDYRVGFTQTGIDQVEFMIAPNIGEPLKPIARIASGGETSRIMLALKTVLSRADETPTLIFDEIDAGIGGRIGAVVGHKLWSLAGSHQVLVVTHLPQLAGFADAHFKVEKVVVGSRTVARVSGLRNEKLLDELTAMLGAEAASARKSAEEILQYVSQVKRQAAPSSTS